VPDKGHIHALQNWCLHSYHRSVHTPDESPQLSEVETSLQWSS